MEAVKSLEVSFPAVKIGGGRGGRGGSQPSSYKAAQLSLVYATLASPWRGAGEEDAPVSYDWRKTFISLAVPLAIRGDQ